MPHTSITSSRLVRQLAGLGVTEPAATRQTFAERLGLWLDWTDAIALAAALHAAGAARPPDHGPGASTAAAAVIEEFMRVRDELSSAITSAPALAADGASAALPPAPPAGAAGPETATDFAPWRRHCVARQRAMEAGIKPLRARARAALAGVSPALASLAALDAVMDQALAARERHLFSALPSWLEQHFERLRKAQAAADAPAPADPGQLRAAAQPDWLRGFAIDLQGVLLAELEIRLHPVEGLLAAMAPAAAGGA